MNIEISAEVNSYLQLRQSLGLSTIHTAPLLRKFSAYMEKHFDGKFIRAEQVLDWACAPEYSPSTQCARLSAARMFLRYLKAIAPQTEIPDIHLIAGPVRPQPFIFSTEQLLKLLSAANQLDKRTIAPRTLKTMLGLMACTGLRPGEVMSLRASEVILDDPFPRLLINRTKFSKRRWVPLHVTTTRRLKLYQAQRKKSEFFFATRKGGRISRHTFHGIFQCVVSMSGIELGMDEPHPTPHSLRHWFAVNRIREWYEHGEEVRAQLPSLSVYLGHVNPANTYWYLSCTPELMSAAARRFESYTEGGSDEE